MPETTYIKAITSTLAEAMRADDRVFVLGEDVAEGGPYTATAGLAEEFGTERVINTPISEAAITGVAIGAAQSGLRPVLEIMFIDFITLALDQLVNAAAKAHFMSGGQLTVPMVLRTQGGAGHRGAAQHSQSLESWLTHVPGLKVVMPSRPVDAAGLLASAIADPNPVVFIENKTLYFRTGEVPESVAPVPIGKAVTVREGGDVTVVALSRLVDDALAAAARLAAEDGIEAEVIDPRTLVPLDLAGDRRRRSSAPGRLVVAHEAVEHGGFGAEIAAQVQSAAFDYLDAPVARVGGAVRPDPAQPAARGRVSAGCGRDRRSGEGDALMTGEKAADAQPPSMLSTAARTSSPMRAASEIARRELPLVDLLDAAAAERDRHRHRDAVDAVLAVEHDRRGPELAVTVERRRPCARRRAPTSRSTSAPSRARRGGRTRCARTPRAVAACSAVGSTGSPSRATRSKSGTLRSPCSPSTHASTLPGGTPSALARPVRRRRLSLSV